MFLFYEYHYTPLKILCQLFLYNFLKIFHFFWKFFEYMNIYMNIYSFIWIFLRKKRNAVAFLQRLVFLVEFLLSLCWICCDCNFKIVYEYCNINSRKSYLLIYKIPRQFSPQWLVIVAPARVTYIFLKPALIKWVLAVSRTSGLAVV